MMIFVNVAMFVEVSESLRTSQSVCIELFQFHPICRISAGVMVEVARLDWGSADQEAAGERQSEHVGVAQTLIARKTASLCLAFPPGFHFGPSFMSHTRVFPLIGPSCEQALIVLGEFHLVRNEPSSGHPM